MKVLVTTMDEKIKIFSYWGMFAVGAFLSHPFFIIFQSSFGFPISSDSFSRKSFLFLSLTKACPVFLASFSGYNIWSTIIFLNFLKSLSCVTIFSAIYPFSWVQPQNTMATKYTASHWILAGLCALFLVAAWVLYSSTFWRRLLQKKFFCRE